MKISVVVPVYNSEKYLSECLESILNQTWRDIEVILINDGSTDRSGQICDMIARQDERVRVIHQSNHGVSYSRNIGLKNSSGDFVSFIDSDDTLELDMYELLVKCIDEYDADIAHCGYKHILKDEIRLVHDTKCVYVQNKQEALECFVSGKLFGGGLWSKLFRREIIEDLSFREDLKINEDVLYNFEAFNRAKKTVFADYAKYNYIARFGTSAVFRTPDETKVKDSCQVARHIYTTLRGSSLEDMAAERYVRTLSGYYKYCMDSNPSLCKGISLDMQDVAKSVKHLGRNMTITVNLIRYCPWVYRIVINIYSKVRKPQWEARKE